jgi:hypothetical protein
MRRVIVWPGGRRATRDRLEPDQAYSDQVLDTHLLNGGQVLDTHLLNGEVSGTGYQDGRFKV